MGHRNWGSVVRLRAKGVKLAALSVVGSMLVLSGLGDLREAEALAVTQSVAKLAGNFTDDTTYSSGSGGNYASSTVGTLVGPGGPVADAIGASLSFTTRYAALLVADTDVNGSGNSASTGTLTASYRISFSVTAAAGMSYIIVVTEKMLGELTAVGDGAGVGTGILSNVTGTYSGKGTQAGSLNLATSSTNTSPTTIGTAADVTISNNGTATITGIVGTGSAQNFTIDFSWTMSAASTTSGNDQGDESAVRLGQPTLTTLTGTTAGSYPGGVTDVPTRVSTCTTTPPDFNNCDGHLVTVNVIETPIPATLALVGLGAVAGGGVSRWRRWRRR